MYLRGMEPGDLDRLYALDVLCFQLPFRFSRAAMRRVAVAENALVRIAAQAHTEEKDGSAQTRVTQDELLGFCIVHLVAESVGTSGYVVTLDVDPRHRGRGIASRLMRDLQISARVAGADRMDLHVFAENYPAIRLYEHLGYRFTGRSPNLYGRGLDALGYRRSLTRPL